MQINRRNFIGGLATASALAAFDLPLTGCTQDTIARLVQVLGNSASQIAAIEGDTSLASKLLADTNAAVTAIDNWKSGTPSTEVIEVLNIVEDDLNLFPQTSQYAPLIDLAIATAEAIIALLPPPATPAPVTARKRRHVELGYPAPKTAKEYKKRYNAILSQHPNWKVSPLQ